jgi:TonB family protein
VIVIVLLIGNAVAETAASTTIQFRRSASFAQATACQVDRRYNAYFFPGQPITTGSSFEHKKSMNSGYRPNRLRKMFVWIVLAWLVTAAPLQAEKLPFVRPAFIGSGPHALINLIDTKKLMQKGQGNAALMFVCQVNPNGRTSYRRVYRLTENAQVLKQEVKDQLYRAIFVPAVYNHKKTWAWFYGTVTFVVVEGKPRLRIFANQDPEELAKESDFVAPQSIYVQDHHYEHVTFPEKAFASEDKPGIVEVAITVDETGKLIDAKVLKEESLGDARFAESALKRLKGLRWTPAYRNGKVSIAPCRIVWTFMPALWTWKP